MIVSFFNTLFKPTFNCYPGRSLRLQLSDGDRSKLGSLGGLAIEAGFEWVHYANRDYIRASVIPDGKHILLYFPFPLSSA